MSGAFVAVAWALTAKDGLLTSAHDLSEGGLAQCLTESTLRNNVGVALTLPAGDPVVALFSESPARALVSLPGNKLDAFTALCEEHGVPQARIGEVTAEPELQINGLLTMSLDRLREVWTRPIPEAMGE